MKKVILSMLCLFLASSFTGLFAQQNSLRRQQVKKVEQKIQEFARKNMQNVPQEQLNNYKNSFEHGEHGFSYNNLPAKEKQEILDAYKKRYLRNLYFKKFPNDRHVYTPEMTPVCENGNFELGPDHFDATYEGQSAIDNPGGYTSGECDAVPTSGVGNFAWNPVDISNGTAANFELVTMGNDPIVGANGGTLDQVKNGTYAVRINASTPCYPDYGIDRLIKPITLQESGDQQIRFNYALVSEFPDHFNDNPFFIARALDGNGDELDRICVISNPANNPFFNEINDPISPDGNNCGYLTILWQDWTCGVLNISGDVGDVVTLEFIVADCGAGGHFGYAYIDDICAESCEGGDNFQGSIELNPFDPCEVTFPFDVCADFIVPQLNGDIGTLDASDASLEILQNGSVVTTLTNGVITGNTICFNVVPADFDNQNGGYDFRVNATFDIGNGTQDTGDTHTIPGQDNDYIFNNPDCCDIAATVANIVCYDQGTTDPSDDTWSLELTVTNSSGTTWNATTPNADSGGYGNATFIDMGDISNFSGTFSFLVADDADPSCATTVTIRIPEPCSAPCKLEVEAVVGECNDNGTPSDSSDDFYNVTITVTGTNGLPWMVKQKLESDGSETVIYNGTTDVTNFELGPFDISDGDWTLWVGLSDYYDCIIDTYIAVPETCCPDIIDAGFDSYQDTTGNIGIIGFELYDNINATHEWYVLSSPNQFGGPYTPVYSTTTTGPAPHTLVINAEPLLFYTVIHKVITDCGEACSKNVHYFNKNEDGLKSKNNAESDVDCCLAFEFWPNGPGDTEVYTAEFNIGIDPQTGAIETYVPNTYSNNPSVVHEWFLFSSPNETGGPYTLVDNQTGYNYEYLSAQDGLYYFLFHKVKSDCGDVCYGQSICRNCGEEKNDNCSFCGVIDCSLIDDLLTDPCDAAKGLRFDCRRAGMSWSGDPTQTYIVEVVWNGCCSTKPSELTMSRWEVTGTSIQMPFIKDSRCFSWRVGTKCKDEIVWSESDCVTCYGPVKPNDVPGHVSTDVKTEAKISPNPNDGNMNIEIFGNDKTAFTLQVYRFDGLLIKTFNENRIENQSIKISWNGKSVLTQGMYFFVITTDKETITKKVIIE